MPSKPRAEERNEIIHSELVHLKEGQERIEAVLATLSATVDSVRVAELAAIRSNQNDLRAAHAAKLAEHESELKLLRYQMGRSTLVWGVISGAVSSGVIAAVLRLVLR